MPEAPLLPPRPYPHAPAHVGPQEMVWLHRLALAEELLETCVATLMGLGGKDLPLLHSVLEARVPQHRNLRTWQVGLLLSLQRLPLRLYGIHTCTLASLFQTGTLSLTLPRATRWYGC